MINFKQIARASALAAMTLGCLSALPSMVYAQDTAPATRQFSAKAGEAVLEAQTLMTAGDYNGALRKLSEAIGLADISAYERSIIYQMQGASYYQIEQFGPAITAFEQALNAGGLLPKESADMRVQIAQLMIANGQFTDGAQRLENYLKGGGQSNPKYIEMLMQAWLQAENYQQALPWAEKWTAAARPKERKHFDVMNFLYSQLKQPERQIDIVKEMIGLWPTEKTLWENWASLLASTGRDQDAFEVTKLIYLSGFEMSEAELVKVVQYYSYYEMPYQAAGVLEKEMNAGRISRDADRLVQLSSLFRQAREYGRAIPVLEAATKLGGSNREEQGKLYAQLGEALYNEGLCERAETAFKQAIDRGYDAGKAWALIATCRYEDVQRQQKLSCQMSEAQKAAAPKTKARQSTIAAFENVPPTSTQSRDAQKWISFIKAERLTFEKRCEFEIEQFRQSCFFDIKRAYEGVFVDGKLTLGNPKCEVYVETYDKEYRQADEG